MLIFSSLSVYQYIIISSVVTLRMKVRGTEYKWLLWLLPYFFRPLFPSQTVKIPGKNGGENHREQPEGNVCKENQDDIHLMAYILTVYFSN